MFNSNLNTVFDRLLTVSQALDEAAGRNPMAGLEGRTRAQLWLPPVDIYETESAFVLEADLPGVHQENVDIQFDKNTLTISGTRAATLPAKEKTAQLRVFSAERQSGGFSRSVRLPEHVDVENIEATFHDGVLTITVPKASIALPRKIAISTKVGATPIEA